MTDRDEKVYKDIIKNRILNENFDIEEFEKREKEIIKSLSEKENNDF